MRDHSNRALNVEWHLSVTLLVSQPAIPCRFSGRAAGRSCLPLADGPRRP